MTAIVLVRLHLTIVGACSNQQLYKAPHINVVCVLFVARPPRHCHHISPVLVLVASLLSLSSSYLKSTPPLIVFLVLVVARPHHV